MKTFAEGKILQSITPVIYSSSKAISFYRKLLNATAFNFNSIRSADAAAIQKINVLNCWDEEVSIDPGAPTHTAAQYAFKSLEAATTDLAAGKIAALVTAPVNKDTIQKAGFNFPGQTEYLAGKFNSAPLMLMISERMRIGFATGHMPLQKVPETLNQDIILQKIKIMNKSLQEDFAINRPKIAILGLNPHAGENGALGNEEKEIILPAVKKAFDEKILVFGPFSPDGFFGSGSFAQFDGILAMYHDQGLIPFKALSFESGVNYTAGMPVVRTSPDHGTAYDIAGKNIASEASFREAVFLAYDIVAKRKEYKELHANPLPLGFSSMGGDQ